MFAVTERMLSILPIALLLIYTDRVLAEIRPQNVPSQFSPQKTILSDKDTTALQSLGMSTSQIQSIFGTEIPNVQRQDEQQVMDSGTNVQQQTQSQQNQEEEYEYESYDSEDDDTMTVPEDSKPTADVLVNDNGKAKKEWWKDPLALFNEKQPQLNQPQSIQEDTTTRKPEPTAGSSDIIATSSTQSMRTDVTSLNTMPPPISNVISLEDSEDEGDDDDDDDDEEEVVDMNSSNTTSTDPVRSVIDSSLKLTSSSESTSSTKSKSPSSGVSSMSISGLSLLFLQKSLSMSPSFFQVVLSFILGKYMFYIAQQVLHTRYPKGVDESNSKDTSTDSLDTNYEDERKEEDLDDLSPSEMEQLQDLGFGRLIPKRRFKSAVASLDIKPKGKDIHAKVSSGGSRKHWFPIGRQKQGVEDDHDGDPSTTLPVSSKITVDSSKIHKKGSLQFSGRKHLEQEIQRLEQEMELLREASLDAESKRVKSEAENDLSRHELLSMRKQLDELNHTNKLLKAQLRDNAQSVQSAVQAEKRKAEDELAKVKAAMVRVLERERKIMRVQVMKILSNVRQSINSSNDENENDLEEYEETREE